MKNNEESKRRRDRLEIIAEILDAAAKGSVKTRIMYRTNLNFSQFGQQIATLLEAGLVEILNSERRKIYKTTEKGNLLLQRLKEASWIFDEMGGRENLNTPIIKKQSNAYFIKR